MPYNMTDKARFVGKLDLACCTFVGTLFGVKAHVTVQIVGSLEHSLTNSAHVWAFTRVGALVKLQVLTPFECLCAQVTRKQALSGVGTAVSHLVAWILGRVAAYVADKEPVIPPAPGDGTKTRRVCAILGRPKFFRNGWSAGSWSGGSFGVYSLVVAVFIILY